MLAQIIDGVNDVIIANLRRLPREHVKRSINRLALADSDVASGFHAVSLRCPIAQTRINTPCRSSKCVHIQCFDAKNWLLFTKQTNSKKCPVCDITIASRTDLVVDEYFDEVLKRIPSTIYEVLIDAHGEWRTRDGMYSSSERTALGMREAHSISRVEGGSRVRPSGEREAIVVSSHGSVIEVREIPRGTISAAAPSKPLPPVHTNIPTSPYSSGARVDGLGRWVVPQRSSGCQTQRDSTLSAPYDPSRPVLLSAHPAWLAAIYGLLLLGGLIEGSLSTWLCVILGLNHNYSSRALGDRTRLICFNTWWTLMFLLFIIHFCLHRRTFLLIVLYFCTWILWTAGAGAISQLIHAQNICLLETFPHCSKLKAIEGLAWSLWILFTLGGVSVFLSGLLFE